ncbi:MAG: hypothetical protein KDB27_00615 [Planctomycetales bacterium]|nr:hypothetical protein [Planctomycetales bacterium]
MQNVVRKLAVAGLVFILLTRYADAHPGHEPLNHGLAHWLFDAAHGGIVLFLILAVTAGLLFVGRGRVSLSRARAR